MKNYLLLSLMFFLIYDLNAKIIYLEPVKNAEYVSISNNIIIGFDAEIRSPDLNSLITVRGTKSGIHSGKIILSEDRKKLIFNPHQPFVFDETVEVRLNGLKTSNVFNNRLSYSFKTQSAIPEWDHNRNMTVETESSLLKNYTLTGDYAALPPIFVTVSNNPSPGNLFLINFANANYNSNILITGNDGSVRYSREMIPNVGDFKRQPNGLMAYFSYLTNKHYAEDSQFNIVDSFYCGNGYTTDGHELRLIGNGHALLMSYDPQTVNMRPIIHGGVHNATVTGLVIQEIDENKNVVFQWRSWDHFNIIDAIYENLTAATIDYVHGNAIELDTDGNILISSRHLSEITKIDRSTGEIIWRLGGVNNEFTFTNDTIPFHYQHDIRRIANGNITLFDNGNHRTPSFSRALEYSLDEVNKTATLVWQYRHTPDIYGAFMGSVQRLRNGNTLIGWGGTNPTLTEVTPSGDVALQMTYPANTWSYRAFRDEIGLTLDVKLAIEGFFDPVTSRHSMNDTVTVFVRSSVSPYSIIDSAGSVLDSAGLTGNFRFYNISSGEYYISVNHRNSLETWSKDGGETFEQDGYYLYDFTNSASQAYGNNQVLKNSGYCIYSGDVNQDGVIELSDVIIASNNANIFIPGYTKTDVNGDNITDLSDVVITNNNSDKFLEVLSP